MPDGCVITIGTFDGVHMGHRAILAEARRLATAHGTKVVALAFDPHPASILRPEHEPPRLTTPDEKCSALRHAGADEVELIEPTRQLLDQSPETFIQSLVDTMGIKAIAEGANFRFGRDRRGDAATLRWIGERIGFEFAEVSPVRVTLCDQWSVQVSSSLIRWLLEQGRVADASRCLGRSYGLSGSVVAGARRGRTIGVPTANVDPLVTRQVMIPADGVYGGTVSVAGRGRHPAAISIGVKPTFADGGRVVEAHLIDFDGDLYGKNIRVETVRWLREQRRFKTVELLQAQLQRDIARTRRLGEQGLLEVSAARRGHTAGCVTAPPTA